jgi:hypothetical protein
MSAPLLAFALGLAGLYKDPSKKYALAALAVSILTGLLWLVSVLCL